METLKSRLMLRNAGNRIYYLKPRPGQPATEPNFLFGPNMTITAQDEQEELLLASMSDIRDVNKESPAIGTTLAELQKQIADLKNQNTVLIAEKAELEKEAVTVRSQVTARVGRK